MTMDEELQKQLDDELREQLVLEVRALELRLKNLKEVQTWNN